MPNIEFKESTWFMNHCYLLPTKPTLNMQKLCYKYKAPFITLIPNCRLEAMNRIQYWNASTLSRPPISTRRSILPHPSGVDKSWCYLSIPCLLNPRFKNVSQCLTAKLFYLWPSLTVKETQFTVTNKTGRLSYTSKDMCACTCKCTCTHWIF